MGLSEINRPLDARSKQTEMSTKPRDFIRPASSQGQKPEKLQLASECTPEHPILPGGMPKRWWWKARTMIKRVRVETCEHRTQTKCLLVSQGRLNTHRGIPQPCCPVNPLHLVTPVSRGPQNGEREEDSWLHLRERVPQWINCWRGCEAQ